MSTVIRWPTSTLTDAGAGVVLAFPAALFGAASPVLADEAAENPGLACGVAKYCPAHWDTPDPTVTEAQVRLAASGEGTACFDNPEPGTDADPVEGIEPGKVPLAASLGSVLDVVE